MFPTNSESLIGISDAFSAFVYGYPSSCPRARCTPYKSVPTLCYTRRPGPVYTGHACRHLPSAVPRISEDRLLQYPLLALSVCRPQIVWECVHACVRVCACMCACVHACVRVCMHACIIVCCWCAPLLVCQNAGSSLAHLCLSVRM